MAEVVAVVGAGTMGAGIAQLALENGHEVVLHDVDAEAVARGRERIRDGLLRRARKLDLDDESAEEWADGRLAALREATTLDEAAAAADVVIEAALEDVDLKRTIFRALDAAALPETILATNTSALSVDAIAAATARPGRVVGLHFFNPAPVMALVEVVRAPATDAAVVDRAVALVRSWGKTPVVCTDSPGFIVNRVNRPFTIEALRILEEGGAGVVAVDEALRGRGFPMGPFELMDLIGIDVNLAVAQAIWEGLGRPDRLRPSPIQEGLVAEGRLGRKAGAGFYPVGAQAASSMSADEIADRILGAVDREAILVRDEGVATEADIDLALRLGAGHPQGPFERGASLQSRS